MWLKQNKVTYMYLFYCSYTLCVTLCTVVGVLSCTDHQLGNNKGISATSCIPPMTTVLTVAHTTSGGYYSSGCLVGLPSGCKHRLLASHQCYGNLQFMLHCVVVKAQW